MQRNNRKNKQWMQNPKQMKNPKIFSIKAIRQPDGSFYLLGGETLVLDRKNQFSSTWVPVDTRDFASVLRNSRIVTR